MLTDPQKRVEIKCMLTLNKHALRNSGQHVLGEEYNSKEDPEIKWIRKLEVFNCPKSLKSSVHF